MALVELKVVMLGKEACGKTSLVERFLNHRFSGEDRYQSTIGAAFGAREVVAGGRGVMVNVWDTAGQERYEAMISLYYRSDSHRL
jgi:Ras-related protein Rab-24